jgi:hypothetical protein
LALISTSRPLIEGVLIALILDVEPILELHESGAEGEPCRRAASPPAKLTADDHGRTGALNPRQGVLDELLGDEVVRRRAFGRDRRRDDGLVDVAQAPATAADPAPPGRGLSEDLRR